MTNYEVTLDKKRRLVLPPKLLKQTKLAKAKKLVAYTDGTGRIVIAERGAPATAAPKADTTSTDTSTDDKSTGSPNPQNSPSTASTATQPTQPPRRARPKATRPAKSSTAPVDTRAVRQWARENGHAVSDRGRIPAAVLEHYRAAR